MSRGAQKAFGRDTSGRDSPSPGREDEQGEAPILPGSETVLSMNIFGFYPIVLDCR